jgi:polyisoprenoid-binding protein YceI
MSHRVALIFAWLFSATASAGSYRGTEAEGKIAFDMVASLHPIHGEAKGFTTDLTVDAAKGVSGKMVADVQKMTTFLPIRDKKMWSYCMLVDQYPKVEFRIENAGGDLAGLDAADGAGKVTLNGVLTIHGVAKRVAVVAEYKHEGGMLRLTGNHKMQWASFEIADPSIGVSKLFPDVIISFDVRLRPTGA